MTFDELNLNKPLLNALNDLGYTTPTPIQQKVFSVVMSGADVCGIAQTGTGKTLAYVLPCLRQYQFSKDRLPQLLILVPTRELVAQVVETIEKMSTYLTLRVVGVFGGVNLKTHVAEIKQGADVLVATPGRLIDLLSNGTLKGKTIKRLVIDEMDEMLNLGFRSQLTTILDSLPAKRQNLLFSATITEEVEDLIHTFFTNPIRVEAAPVGTPLDNIQQQAYEVPNFHTKLNLLEWLLQDKATFSKVMVFIETKAEADQLFEQLDSKFPNEVGVIHSNKAQNNRFQTVQRFKTGEIRILIATDLIARGLDVAEVSHVINIDTPELPETYIHRIGRTGRVDQKGVSITFITESEKEYQQAIESLMNQEIPMLPFPEEVEVSTLLRSDERPVNPHKIIEPKLTPRDSVGAAFHEKSAKNSKVNVRRNHAAEMMKKYGRPIKKTRKNN
ncbi:DEAD/DEAH box helicase [Siphonobacter sp. SORGH_AS_1065]|uniref:DEAD/DEAH box helicase n=1 Tax=Siphonobacter sp. SORGH_AS_1065 TaxID=3041795 RepID=UPI0027898162|nr:DEAD/DEAH box helicase [Siphonobacter sp. SORGH_AS_1065]MDQ1089662.1 ATP-dependent RNA helicase RhlE [Siphonobacter sp. SORGH_AS_1065]